MRFQPFIVGSGMSSKAIAKALSVIQIVDPVLDIAAPVQIGRHEPLKGLPDSVENPLLCIGNPHGLHAKYIADGEAAGFQDIVVDKPSCVTLDEIASLREVVAQVAVLHGFRQMWGPQSIKRMLDDHEFGDIISIEGRYWQSSAADIAFGPDPPMDKDWKSDLGLSGSYDTLIDLGTHWTDLMLFLAGARPKSARVWLSYANAIAPHRDTHAHLYFEFSEFRTLGSISKTVHGAGNDLEFTIIGTKRAASWTVREPDEIRLSRGNQVSIVRRKSDRYGSQQPAFHGLGWLEGYTEIIHDFLLCKAGKDAPPVPTLAENLVVMEVLLAADRL